METYFAPFAEQWKANLGLASDMCLHAYERGVSLYHSSVLPTAYNACNELCALTARNTWYDYLTLSSRACAVDCEIFSDRGYNLNWLFTLVALVMVITVISRYLLWKYFGDGVLVDGYWWSLYMRCLLYLTQQPRLPACNVRTTFTNMTAIKPTTNKNHTHPDSAAVRNANAEQCRFFASLIGSGAYYVQKSAADVRNDRKGCRTYFWGKDLNVTVEQYNPGPSDVVCMVDVDMYLNMPKFLATDPRIYAISTFQPSAVACSTGEISFTFNAADEVVFNVSGGAEFQHKVWNYKSDILVVRHRMWDGFRMQTTAYNIDRRQTGPHHQLICLSPIRTMKSLLIHPTFHGGELQRLKVSDGKFNRLTVITSDGPKRSVGETGKYNCATVPIDVDDTISVVAALGKTDLSIAQVKAIVKDDDPAAAAALVAYHRERDPQPCDVVVPVKESVHHYNYNVKSLDDVDGKQVMEGFMTPLHLNAYAPINNSAAEKAAVEGRITNVKSDVELTPYLMKLMNEFVEHVIPEPHCCFPVDQDFVANKMKRPNQQQILEDGMMDLAIQDNVKSFLKAETYTDVKDPRIISTIEPDTKFKYAQFIYAFEQTVLKKMKWYAFGMKPRQIARRVAKICAKAKKIIGTDFNRFDGRVSVVLRELEKLLMMRGFGECYHAELSELMNKQQYREAKMPQGTKYETGTARLSGSQETSCFNTICNAFIAYVALRSDKPGADYRSIDEAWEALGIYGGDDGLTADVELAVYEKASVQVGQKLTSEVIERYGGGVKFLARIYSPFVWTGSENSMCDVPRQLSKFHTTHKLPSNVTALQKLHEKCMGFFMTDRNTPILGELATEVINRLGRAEFQHGIANYFSDHPEHEQFPNDDEEGWMLAYVLKMLPSLDVARFRKWLCRAFDDMTILSPPLVVDEPKVVVVGKDVVLQGDVVRAKRVPAKQAPKKEKDHGQKRAAKVAKVPSSKT